MSGNTAYPVCLELVMEFKHANTAEVIIAALLAIVIVLLAVVLVSVPRPHTCGRCGARTYDVYTVHADTDDGLVDVCPTCLRRSSH